MNSSNRFEDGADRPLRRRPGAVTSVLAATKHTLRSISRRWQQPNDEIKTHERLLGELTSQLVPQLVDAFGVRHSSGDAHRRWRQHRPSPLRSGLGADLRRGTDPRLNRGGHRQANAALYRAVIVRMQYHQPTRAYVAPRTAEGETKAEVIRCLKRLLAREIWALLRPLRAIAIAT